MIDRPPALTRKTRAEIEAAIQVGDGVTDRLKGDPKGEDFKRVYAAGLEALLESTTLHNRYKYRFMVATEQRDTAYMLAAVYGLQLDMSGRLPTGDRGFVSKVLRRAMHVISEDALLAWIDDYGGGSISSVQRRRALVEYLDEKLAALDQLVHDAYPDNQVGLGEPRSKEASAAPGM
jgi:hypothetical protein